MVLCQKVSWTGSAHVALTQLYTRAVVNGASRYGGGAAKGSPTGRRGGPLLSGAAVVGARIVEAARCRGKCDHVCWQATCARGRKSWLLFFEDDATGRYAGGLGGPREAHSGVARFAGGRRRGIGARRTCSPSSPRSDGRPRGTPRCELAVLAAARPPRCVDLQRRLRREIEAYSRFPQIYADWETHQWAGGYAHWQALPGIPSRTSHR